MSKVFVHKYAGNLSAFGMALADIVHEESVPTAFQYNNSFFDVIDERIRQLIEKCVTELKKLGFKGDDIRTEIFLNMRYEKTDFPLMTRTESLSKDSPIFCSEHNFKESFLQNYRTQFGFTIPERNILVDDIRVRGIGSFNDFKQFDKKSKRLETEPKIEETINCYFDGSGYMKTCIHLLENLGFGHQISGPAILIDPNFTVLVEPHCRAILTERGNIVIEIDRLENKRVGTNLDAIQLSIFSHRFMSIAEQMGRVLQRTSISTNIKERLDFSCALFGPDGGLVSNAPHIPVHLGSMGRAVQFQLEYLKNDLSAGDVILTNHPTAGGLYCICLWLSHKKINFIPLGSHLPDLTVITPVFYSGQKEPIFFVANRGHHADIGGLTPGIIAQLFNYLFFKNELNENELLN